jgi:hypothetical protein
LATICSLANISFLYVDMCLFMSFNFLFTKGMGLSFCKSVAPCPNIEELHSMVKSQVKSGVKRISVEARASLKLSKACRALIVNERQSSLFYT